MNGKTHKPRQCLFIVVILSLAWVSTGHGAYFSDLDTNYDKQIQRKEFNEFYRDTKGHGSFEDIDSNKDRILDYDEWYQFKKERKRTTKRPGYVKSDRYTEGNHYIFVRGKWYKKLPRYELEQEYETLQKKHSLIRNKISRHGKGKIEGTGGLGNQVHENKDISGRRAAIESGTSDTYIPQKKPQAERQKRGAIERESRFNDYEYMFRNHELLCIRC